MTREKFCQQQCDLTRFEPKAFLSILRRHTIALRGFTNSDVRYRISDKSYIMSDSKHFSPISDVPISLITDIGLSAHLCVQLYSNSARARILKHLLEAEKSTFQGEPSFQRSECTAGLTVATIFVCCILKTFLC
jgi:hypothetical protein